MKTEEEYKAEVLQLMRNIEVLQLMRDLYPTLKGEEKERAERLFPELKESEDEKIRKSLIGHLKECRNNTLSEVVIGEYGKWIACLKKHGEKNPIDNVRPKFHKGDWVVFNDKHESVYQVEKIENFQYTLRHILGGSMPLSFSHEDMIRTWTIQDIKDGDIICSGQIILLFKNWEETDWNFSIAYAGINVAGELKINHKHWLISSDSRPATKEQRDILIEAMGDAGYTFDFNKKELKKIEQNPAWSEEDEDEKILKHLITFFKGEYGTNSNARFAGIKVKDIIAYLEKQDEQKQEWSEDDLISLGYLATFVDENGDSFYGKNKPNVVKWIRSFANLNPTQKQELSEEDVAVLDALIRRLEGEDLFVSTHLAVSCLKRLKEKVHPKEEQHEEDRDPLT